MDVHEKNTIIGAIFSGDLDKYLNEISEAVAARKKATMNIVLGTLEPGDKVTFAQNIRPKYLAGGTATVKRKMPKNILIEITSLPQSAAGNTRFKVGQTIRCPPALLVTEDVQGQVEAIKTRYTP